MRDAVDAVHWFQPCVALHRAWPGAAQISEALAIATGASSNCRSAASLTRADCLPQMNPLVSELSLYDVANVPGVAADVSHMNTKAQVKVTSRPPAYASPLPAGLAALEQPN